MSIKGEFDWRAHRRDWDYEKYGGHLDPDDKDIFFGPVTVRELKRSVEVSDAIIRKAREKKRLMNAAAKENLENIRESEMNPTFESKNIKENTASRTRNTPFGVNRCLLDDTLPSLCLPTPLVDKVHKSIMKTPVKRSSYLNRSYATPRVVGNSGTKDALLDSTLPEEDTLENVDVEHPNAPEEFGQNTNEASKEMNCTSSLGNVFSDDASKLKSTKAKKTPMKRYLSTKSPVADYIHRGVHIKSMSKSRHSHCVNYELPTKSKSDHKISKPCAIPQPISDLVKKKLILEKPVAITAAGKK